MSPTITFIGGGNMAQAIAGGLVAQKHDPKIITIVDRHPEKLTALQQTLGVRTVAAIVDTAVQADVVILSVKPQTAKAACAELKPHLPLTQKPIIVSVMSGISTQTLADWLGHDYAIVRAMPNTPAKIGLSATGLYANANVTDAQKHIVTQLMNAIGISAWLKQEEDINSVIALAGSAPAYYFYFMEIMQAVAIEMGLEASMVKQFAEQTIVGAAALAAQSGESVQTLRAKVTSKAGTTEAAIKTMQAHHLDDILKQAMLAAAARGAEMGKLFG